MKKKEEDMGKIGFIVYSKDGCQPCKATIRHLVTRGADYGIMAANEHTGDLKARGFKSSPVILVIEEDDYGIEEIDSFSGFKPDIIDKYMENKGKNEA